MSNRLTAAVAGGFGVIAAVAAFALAVAIDQRPAFHDAMNLRPLKLPRHAQLRQLAEDLVEQPSVLVIPTVTIVGEVPRHGAAEMQRLDPRDRHKLLEAAPWRSAPAVADDLHR